MVALVVGLSIVAAASLAVATAYRFVFIKLRREDEDKLQQAIKQLGAEDTPCDFCKAKWPRSKMIRIRVARRGYQIWCPTHFDTNCFSCGAPRFSRHADGCPYAPRESGSGGAA
jgi:hypothetical protein